MDANWLLGLTALAALSLFTPGPNNIMLAASGANFGLARSTPHMLGVNLGFAVMLLPVSLGFGTAFEAYPAVKLTMKILGSAALLWLAWRIANAGRAEGRAGRRPLTFIEASGFQWINPKGWMITVSVSAAYMNGVNPEMEAAAAALIFAFVGGFSSVTWTAFGVGLRRLLATDAALRRFNLVMGVLTAACVIPVAMS